VAAVIVLGLAPVEVNTRTGGRVVEAVVVTIVELVIPAPVVVVFVRPE
jgi:hypothetical protein